MIVTPAEGVADRKKTVELSATQTRRLLALSKHRVDRLTNTKYLRPTLAEVEALAGRPTVSGGIPILRLGDPGLDGQRRIGHQRYDRDEVLTRASLGWWGGPVDTVLSTGWLGVAISGMAIAILQIDGVSDSLADNQGYRRTWFAGSLAARVDDIACPRPRILVPDLDEVAHNLLGNWVPNPPGAPIVVV